MSRKCSVTGKGPLSGHNVSHAQNKTKRKFLPNMQRTSLYSERLGRFYKFTLSAKALRTIEHKGGLDAYVIDTAKTKLGKDFRKIKKAIEKQDKRQALAG